LEEEKKLTPQCKNRMHIRFVSTQSAQIRLANESCCSHYHPKTDLSFICFIEIHQKHKCETKFHRQSLEYPYVLGFFESL